MSQSPILKMAAVMPAMATIPARWSISAMAGDQMISQMPQATIRDAKIPKYRLNVMGGV